jgi:hypothetical protein
MNEYPLTLQSLIAGVLAGVAAAVLLGTPLAGYVVFALIAGIGLTWRRDHAPILPFIFAMQWLEVSSGYLFSLITGVFPSEFPAGDIEYAVALALTGLLTLAVGARVALMLLPRNTSAADDRYIHNLRGLFWLVVGLYAINYVYIINPKQYAGLDAILERLLGMRQIPLMLLWFEVARRRSQWSYLWLSLAWVFVPQLGSYFSDFKTPLILLLIVFASAWKPWERGAWKFTLAGATRTLAVVGVCLFLVLTWQAGVKKETRRAYDADEVGSDPVERVTLFVSHAVNAVPVVLNETETVFEGLVARVSYVTFFSRTLEYVPAKQPHADGELLQMALTNAFMPRFLFPDKPVLPSDSYYTRRFTGLLVTEEGTSISIGYMAEFYADWGLGGMFLSILLYGFLMGTGAWIIDRLVRPRVLVDPAMISALMVVSLFEHQFVKTFAALNIGVGLVVVTLMLVRKSFVRFLDLRSDDGGDVTDDDELAQAVEILQPLPGDDEPEEERGRVLPLRRPS